MDNNEMTNDNADYGYLASTIACIGDGIISTDINARIVFINNAASELTGWYAEEAIGKSLYEVLPIQNEKADLNVDFFSNAVNSGQKVGLKRNSFITTQKGKIIFLSASCAPNIDREGRISGAVIAFRDITRIRRMDEELLNERNNFRTIFESSPVGIAIVDKEAIVKEVNPAFLKLFNNELNAIINQKIGNFLQCVNSFGSDCGCGRAKACGDCSIRKTVKAVLAHGKSIVMKDLRYNHRVDNMESGSWLNISFVPIHMSGQENVMLVIENITEQKHAQEGLRRYQLLTDNTNEIILFFNAEGYIIDANMAAQKVFGYSMEEFKNKSVNDLRKTEMNLQEYMNSIPREGNIIEVENYKKDGTVFPVEISIQQTSVDGMPVFMSIARDISERKRIENEIKESKIKYQSLFMNMSSGFAYFHNITDEQNRVVDLEFIEVNSTFEEMFDTKMGLIKNRQLSKVFPDFFTSFQSEICITEDTLRQNRSVKIPEYFEPTLGRWFSVSTYRSSEGFIAAIISDITARKKAETEMSRAKEEAESANKAKSQFLANMSHEIRTPLNGMTGMLDLTLQSNLSTDQKDNLNIAKSCASSLLRVINDILDFSKMEAGKLTLENIIFNIKDMIDDVSKVHMIKAEEKGIGLNYQFSSGLPDNLIGDPTRLKQVLNNLISNAIKFTESGDVTLSVKKYSRKEDIIELIFSVEDSGIGIPKEKQELLFRSFSQVDSSYTRKFGGTGLGLVISKQLVEMMGGKIWVTSEEDKGSTFFFTVQMGIGYRGEIGQGELMEEPRKALARRVLFVEDDKINQMVVENFLKLKGHTVRFANNGVEALDILSRETFDIILMDIQMPIMDGLQTTIEIRKKEQNTGVHTPIIAVTAYALKGDKEKFMTYGMDGYISKPIDSKLLYQVLDKYGGTASNGFVPTEDHISSVKQGIMQTPTNGWVNYSNSTENELKELISNNDTIVNDEEMIIDLLEDITKNLLMLKKALELQNYTAIEGAAHHIKVMAAKMDLLTIKNYAFKIELATRRKDLKDAAEALKILEVEFYKLRIKKINNRVEEKR